jgi:hypothetical protein
MARSALSVSACAVIGALIVFATLIVVQVTAQQQMTPAEHHHPNSISNQSGINITTEQLRNTKIVSNGTLMNHISNIKWISLVDAVKVSGMSIIDNEHIATNLRYDGEGEPPGVSVIVAITNSSSDTVIDSMMQKFTTTSASNSSSVRIMQSGSNYLEAGWQVQEPNSATVLVQLDGNIAEGGGHVMVIVVPFLHH